MRIAAVILAAGKSERMRYPKTLLIFGKETAIDRVVRVCREAGCEPVIVVLGHEADRIRSAASLSEARVVVNDGYERGQTSSLQAGVRALPHDVEAFVLFPVDHVLVKPNTITSLIDAYGESRRPVVIPVCEARRGHPVLCDSSLAAEFLALAPDAPARAVTVGDLSRVMEVPVEDGEIVRDLDTPADYSDALDVYAARGGEAGFLAPKGAGRPTPKRPPV